MKVRRFAALLGAVAAAAALPTGTHAQVGPPFTPVMTGLDNPRGLAFGPDGALYVVETGVGGERHCFAVRGEETFAGRTGAVSRLRQGVQRRIARGFPSYAGPGGVAATGVHDISFAGPGGAMLTIGLGANPALRAQQCGALGPTFGWLVSMRLGGGRHHVVDLAAYEAAANPDGGPPDSNPYGLLAEPLETYATDAGGNTLLKIAGGVISTVAVFPSRATGRGTDSVPTTVARGPDGALYVGELTGGPFTPGAANVWRVVPGEEPAVFEGGFTAIIDIAFGQDGSLYVLEHATEPFLEGPGDLVKVAPDGTRTVIASGFIAPTSVAIGPHGDFFVSNCGIFPGSGPFPCTGEVVRFEAEE